MDVDSLVSVMPNMTQIAYLAQLQQALCSKNFVEKSNNGWPLAYLSILISTYVFNNVNNPITSLCSAAAPSLKNEKE
ncbi:hypothetical protein KIN20_014256 [Parelaphostrongylus tenuis]|uniref:Uncharacterized protein n=1 Tax=Parelaphostrongylus tenuis TaxID=148309 RepID=A0AAD5MEP1_PARTN|nr:hypothetical protein KIN20_014256 [Parelaphostrongylus tenuis]